MPLAGPAPIRVSLRVPSNPSPQELWGIPWLALVNNLGDLFSSLGTELKHLLVLQFRSKKAVF